MLMRGVVCVVVLLQCIYFVRGESREERSLGNLITEVISRSSSTSEVLTLNLKNLIIILVIKVRLPV